mgnify:CR=1 FL=1
MFNEQLKAAIGKILSPHGVAGQVKVFPYSDYPERVTLLTEVELVSERQSAIYTVEKGQLYGRFWLVKFKGVDTREEAARLNGALMVIDKEERIALPPDSFYHDQLVGLKVFDKAGTELGRVVDVIATGGHDLIQVERPAASDEQQAAQPQKLLIPAVKRFIVTVKPEDGIMIIDPPPGLLDL